MSDDRARNRVLTIGLILGVGVLCWFLATVTGTSAEVQAQALGNVVGGLVGAAATALAVILTLYHPARQQAGAEDKLRKLMLAALTRQAAFLTSSRLNILGAIDRGESRSPDDVRAMRPTGIVIDVTSRAKFTEAFPEAAVLMQRYLD